MANLKEVRLRIASVKSTQQITKAMKMVSAAKFRRATDAIVQMRPYANKLKGMLANLSDSVADMDNVYTQERELNNVLLVVITSNRGLAGAFNNSVIKATNALIAEKFAEHKTKGKLFIVAVGKKSQDFYSKNGFQVIGNNNELFNKLNFANASQIVEQIMEGFAEGKVDHVEMIYNQFKNAAVQIITLEQLLPLPKAPQDGSTSKVDYLFEPSKEEIVEELIPKSIKLQFYKALLDSHAAEHGARMTAMDKATENAGELLKSLTLQYNQARQAAITNEILEIVSGANALAEG
ncbi:ATP synthase F1 subunit gamma [Solitalea canadensis]|uniref:ATP synthase gamma chain n=1 Tax=Solitalea canadensis (strain ATCC 29591 / DSM 3403 / JCM 21819 / LMG 8368 / NBRC 15130 / NCIMB 12057 / USAM 9D) TaxID=929556 RepID=H8KWX3_SOLCM|nr:ATP synthase F1 subunit gamma [Solitalea canadensis]AFD08302.1 ATP synthase, F1 gamma subunit [Solitalea canadensis DSM 3403]